MQWAQKLMAPGVLAKWEEQSPLAGGLLVGQALFIHVLSGFSCEVFAAGPAFNLVPVPRITGAGCQWEPPELLQHKGSSVTNR